MTCLMLAAREGYSKVINLLVSHGAELHAQDDMGCTVSKPKLKATYFPRANGGAVLCRTSHCFEYTLATACV